MKRGIFENLCRRVVTIAIACAVFPACAEATNYQGVIKQIVTSGATNFAFRIYLDTGFGTCASNFGYINVADSNYQAKVASYLTAYALAKTVVVSAAPDANGFCQISDLSTQP